MHKIIFLAFALYTFSASAETNSPSSHMSLGEAAILGVVEGLTEYLPVSSTGHLILTQRLLGIGFSEEDKVAADAYAICIQLGAILAVLGLFHEHIKRMILGLFGKDQEGLKLLINTLVAFLPAAVVGLTFADAIKTKLFGLWPVTLAWFVGGVVLLIIERYKFKHYSEGNDIYTMSPLQALIIGLCQCVAVWPGTSRSLATILGGRIAGLSLQSSVIFSFILGVVTLSASTLYDLLDNGTIMIEIFGLSALLVGMFFALISALAAVRWMVGYLQRHGMAIFGWYRIVLALCTAGLLYFGLLQS